ncbi:MAG TPA: hypothetical protein VHE30_29320 [Polyangiaceae bacterium]|nr:hypothetical protein [Polyangiaceae bacterium]
MKIALFMTVCEGESVISRDALQSLVRACEGHDLHAFIVDDASESAVGDGLVEFAKRTHGVPGECLRMKQSLGFHGMAKRLFAGLERVAEHGGDFDQIVKLDPDALVVRRDLGRFLAESTIGRRGLAGEMHGMRLRDCAPFLLDQLPFGYRRRSANGVLAHDKEFRRVGPVWWTDIGVRALLGGFHFRYVPGCFFVLGGDTLRALHERGYLARSQARHGLVFNDDLILTASTYAVGHPVVDLSRRSPHWGWSMSMAEDTPMDVVVKHAPYVVHPLKKHAAALQRRDELHAHYGLGPVPGA